MWELPARHRLPPVIRFFIRLKSVRVPFPLPPSYPASCYLHEARIIEGQEEMGPVAHVPFDSSHVVGMHDHNLLSFTQLVVEVPSTNDINPAVRPTRLSFHPRHESQLHDYSAKLQRIIIPVFSSGGVPSGSERASSAPSRERPGTRVAEEQRIPFIRATDPVPTGAAAAAPHAPPAFVPQLAIPKLRTPTIGSPFNAASYLKVLNGKETEIYGAGFISDGDYAGDGWKSPSPSSRGSRTGAPSTGAWTNAHLPRPHVEDYRQQRSLSPGARAAAARVATQNAELLIVPLASRAVEGFLLTPQEMRRFRYYASLLELRGRSRSATRNSVQTSAPASTTNLGLSPGPETIVTSAAVESLDLQGRGLPSGGQLPQEDSSHRSSERHEASSLHTPRRQVLQPSNPCRSLTSTGKSPRLSSPRRAMLQD